MPLPVSKEGQRVLDFFEHLSSSSFNDKISIKPEVKHKVDDNGIRVMSATLYKVSYVAKYHWLNPIRYISNELRYIPNALHFLPFLNHSESPKNKRELANNLLGMVKKHEKTIAVLTNLDGAITNLERIAEKIVRNTTQDQAKEIESKFKEIIGIVSKAQIQHFATNRGHFENKEPITKPTFYKQLANTGWFGKIGGFNERIHIKQPTPHRFEVYTSSKLWLGEKVRKIWNQEKGVSSVEKIATVQNLANMIVADSDLIYYLGLKEGLNVSKMVTNLEAMKGRITRNTEGTQKDKIETELNGAIIELNKLAIRIEEKINNSWKGKLKNCVWNTTFYIPNKIWEFTTKKLKQAVTA